MTAYLQEILGISGILLVKAFATQRAERARFRELNDELRRRVVRQEMIARWFGMLLDTLRTGGPALLWLFGGWLILRHQGTVGTVVTFLVVLLPRLYGAVGSLGNLHVNLMGSLALFHRLFQVLDLPVEVADRPGARPLARVRGAVGFEEVTFAYRPDLPPALDRLSFQAEPGQLVALVGPTGAGKTTVTSLLARFYDPQAGRVLLDGHDLRDVTLASLGAQVGIVFQDSFLFHASIADNLRYARPDAGDQELVAAATAAQLHDFIRALPDGYDTVVGERGHRLSGGEKQRVAIARVLLKDPRILILDEATSHLDTVSEQLVQAALRPLLAGRTSLVIAHRLSTVLAADRILVLDRGRLVEQGSHAALLAAGGLYARLYERQFQPQQSQHAASPLA
jgi:ATP-binding cassette, subfamily B, bacterial